MITCTFENGNTASLRHVTVACLVLKAGEILLAKRSYRLAEGGKWCLPGGYMDQGETTLGATRREVREETGCEIENIQLLGINDSPARPGASNQTVDFIYFADVVSQGDAHDWETAELAWFPLTKLPQSEEIAYDHLDSINLYISYLRDPFTLPIIYTHDRLG